MNLGAAAWVSQRVSLALDYDSAWDSSHVGVFELTQTGVIITKSHLQNFLVGPRISFPGVLKFKQTHVPRLWPFAEVQVGSSHLSSSLETPTTSASQVRIGQCFFMDAWRRSRLSALTPLGDSFQGRFSSYPLLRYRARAECVWPLVSPTHSGKEGRRRRLRPSERQTRKKPRLWPRKRTWKRRGARYARSGQLRRRRPSGKQMQKHARASPRKRRRNSSIARSKTYAPVCSRTLIASCPVPIPHEGWS